MKIILNKIIPLAFKDDFNEFSDVWDKKITLENNNSYFVSSNSGKGKSSLLNFLYGIRNDFEGEIIINNKNTSKLSLQDWSELRKNKIAYLPQDLKLINHLSVWDNLILKNNLTDYYTTKEIKEFIEVFNIANHIHKPINKLSLGQQQRVALIRTILQPFKVLLLDEPFSHIDNNNIEIALKFINNICNKEKAFYILATLGYNYGITENKIINL